MKNKQTINEIMKSHKPWTVGVCTDRSNNSIFFPVRYNKLLDRWYGYIKQTVNDNLELETAWRKGKTKRYKIKSTGNEKLPKDDIISRWIKNRLFCKGC